MSNTTIDRLIQCFMALLLAGALIVAYRINDDGITCQTTSTEVQPNVFIDTTMCVKDI